MILKDASLEVIITEDKWNRLLHNMGNYDFYHTYDYHMTEKSENRQPVLLKYMENEIIIAIPFLLRKIANTYYYDATSVYGYTGPISKNITTNFDNSKFLAKLDSFFEENNIISVFSRLNPYIDHQEDVLKGYGNIINTGKVVNIDLNLDLYLQKRKYQERLRTYINKSRRNCLIKKLETTEELSEFIDIYHENMNRVNAAECFYFDEGYFNNLLNSDQFNAEILLVKDLKSGKVQFYSSHQTISYNIIYRELDMNFYT